MTQWRHFCRVHQLERPHKKVKRHTAVIGIFTKTTAMPRQGGILPAALHDRWQIGKRLYSLESLATVSPIPVALTMLRRSESKSRDGLTA